MEGKLIAGRYRVDMLIGSGGMANVYQAYDLQQECTVALKVLKDEHREDAEFIRRFEREAQAVLTLSHPNIVKSYDVGRDDGVNFIVLEYVGGSTLKEIIQNNGALPPKQAVDYACQVLSALAHAHDCGIIHRDVKPQNVMITPSGKAMLTDFGIARDTGQATRTFAGTNVIGSVHYISPEQARGDDVTQESDIYSCAMMLFEMLTGQVPFAGDNSVTVALKHLQEEITPPANLNPKISRALSDVVVKAGAKDPALRYSTAAAMSSDLVRALKEPHGHFARLETPSTLAKKQEQRKKRTRIGVVVISVLLAIGLFSAMFFIARSWRDTDNTPTTEFVTPQLVGKPETEAGELATLRGFVMVVEGTVDSDEYPEGYVITQSPMSGVSSRQGATITVTVSGGDEYTQVPELVGSQLQEAIIALSEADLRYSIVEYVASDLPDGQIIKQEPEAGVTIFDNDYVDIWVSGLPDLTIDMPVFTGQTLSTALLMAKENGMTRVWVRPSTPETAMDEESIVKQNPASGISTNKNALVELWVCRTFLGGYSADIAYNVDIEESDKTVVVTAKLDSGAELVLYEAVLPVGNQQPVSFTAYMQKQGDYECVIYVNGEEIKRNVITFSLHK